jgi:hypothetical protein
MSKTTSNFNQDSQLSGGPLNTNLPEYESGVPTTQLRRSVGIFWRAMNVTKNMSDQLVTRPSFEPGTLQALPLHEPGGLDLNIDASSLPVFHVVRIHVNVFTKRRYTS